MKQLDGNGSHSIIILFIMGQLQEQKLPKFLNTRILTRAINLTQSYGNPFHLIRILDGIGTNLGTSPNQSVNQKQYHHTITSRSIMIWIIIGKYLYCQNIIMRKWKWRAQDAKAVLKVSSGMASQQQDNQSSIQLHTRMNIQKFQIVVVVSQINSGQQSVIDAKCSPYIFVDSRKHARQQALNNNIQLIIDPFLPENLEKQFVKKERKNQPKCLLKVDNTIQGLINYFTAQNIRHKIKHPLFLALKFEKCVKLYLKKDLFVKNSKDAILRVQSILMQSSQERRDSNKEMALLFQVDQTNEQEFKKVYEISQIFENDIFMLFLKEDQIPEGYIPIEDISRINVSQFNKLKKLNQLLIQKLRGIIDSQINQIAGIEQ
ncbi:unnamed protein product (macronuclear) [Paramecium tetraurelia]|uniref:SH3 domain-containing protein n=1 Tax=Paramecium tetraurelia TaxID=5888 RepID=A0BJ50_PARTE|nr:uncharacterized protein GSPATT00004940001 [Paramecium tetraurelia]CAK58567.1 unnamed protein product [Paramecium tetraurelia]|eukprot:XP_001425965.1 hypothetical protein (macronuclear) [Paramecium tetraurelia strain d4-2]